MHLMPWVQNKELKEKINLTFGDDCICGARRRQLFIQQKITALLNEMTLEKKDIALEENHSFNGKTIIDWEGQDLFQKGRQSVLAELQDHINKVLTN